MRERRRDLEPGQTEQSGAGGKENRESQQGGHLGIWGAREWGQGGGNREERI